MATAYVSLAVGVLLVVLSLLTHVFARDEWESGAATGLWFAALVVFCGGIVAVATQ